MTTTTTSAAATSLAEMESGPVRVWLGGRYDTGRELFALGPGGGDERGARLGYAYEYALSTLTVDVGVVTVVAGARYVLLVRRGGDPFRGCWALPGGFVDVAGRETPRAAAARELREETGLEPRGFAKLGAKAGPGRDPRGYSATLLYAAAVQYGGDTARARAGSDVDDVRWVELDPDHFVGADAAAGGAGTVAEFGAHEERLVTGTDLRGRRIPMAFDHARLCRKLHRHYAAKDKSA